MIIASQKKKENIVEYLIYMWQVEDLIRAFALDMEKIEKFLISRYDVDDQKKAEIREWYSNLCDMMRIEGADKGGHLQINKNVIIELTDLHNRLSASTKQAFYTASFYKTLPYIVELRARAGENKKGEIETCFDAVYGILMLKMQGKEISEATQQAVTQITTFLNTLSDRYNAEKSEELEL
ncbi:MAG: DUF4924 family protein [Bacteroidales bacterium]